MTEPEIESVLWPRSILSQHNLGVVLALVLPVVGAATQIQQWHREQLQIIFKHHLLVLMMAFSIADLAHALWSSRTF